MILLIIVILFSFFLESFITNIFSTIIPFFVIGMIVIISRFNIEDKKKYITVFILGIIYDLLYTNLLFIHGFIFLLILYISNTILKESNNLIKMLFTYYIVTIVYILLQLIYMIIYTNIYIPYVLIKIVKSTYINSIYFIISYIIFIVVISLIKNIKHKRAY